MKVVMAQAPETLLEQRRRTGADRWDEMWDGVLHMPPMPNRDHQDLEGALETWLRRFWTPTAQGKVYHQINLASVGGWPDRDYRIPDLVLLTPDRFDIDRNEYFEGAPAVVVEIRSPGDETYEKFDFYARLGIPEVWVIDRDSRQGDVYRLVQGRYDKQTPDREGWQPSLITGVRMRAGGGKLVLQIAGDQSTQQWIP